MHPCEPFRSGVPLAYFGTPQGAPCTPVEERRSRLSRCRGDSWFRFTWANGRSLVVVVILFLEVDARQISANFVPDYSGRTCS